MSVLSTLTIDLRGNSAHFQRELKKANQKSISFAQKVRANSATVVKSLGAIGVVGGAALAAIYKQSSANIDALAKQADKLGMTTQALAGLQHAADLTGVSSKTLNKGLLDMTVKIQDAAKGMGEGKEALKALGLDAQKLAKMSPDKAFVKISEAMKGVEHHGNKVAIAYDLFGAKGTDLLNTLALGETALNQTAEEAKTLGLALNRVDAAKVEAANDAMTKSAGVVSGLGNTITVTLAPYVKAISDEFYNAALEAGGFGTFATKAMDAVTKAVAYVANTIHGLKAVWKGLKLVTAAAITGMLKGIAWLDKGLTHFLNIIPGVEAKTSGFINGMADAMHTQMDAIKTELAAFANEPLPYDGIVAWAEEAKRQSLAAAEAVALDRVENIGYTAEEAGVLPAQNKDDARDNEEKKTQNHEEKILKIKSINSQKFAKIQDALRVKNLVKEKAAQLKIALGEGWVAIQKAWSSAPFPYNMPAVVLATGATAVNVASISGLEKGGNVGGRSIVEVGERNKPEVLAWGGRNFLLGGNGGAVFNSSQLQPVANRGENNGVGNSKGDIHVHITNEFTAMDNSGLAGLLDGQEELVYNAVAMAKADKGEAF
ncbi:MAG: hypothetical protein HRT38_09815 [Alteromonadaceae bacterium]|nr:hypothetical protein [Alteromonadaceae bacterium]